MFRIAIATAATAALVAAAPAGAASLGGAPELTLVDSHHAQLRFTAHDVARRADGSLDAKITFAPGKRGGTPAYTGKRHAGDPIYRVTVTSKSAWRLDTKYTVRFSFAGGKTTSALVKLHR